MTRHRLLGAAAALMLGFGGALVVFEAVERGGPVDPAESVVGSPDINKHCSELGDRFGAAMQGTDAYGWRCAGLTSGMWETRVVDISDVCASQFGSSSYSIVLDVDDPMSWRCVVAD
ncbi:MAG TPA: hypothetical protein VMM60_09780 [Ilumatobacter sp.]|nr:hypothetical protein [Ilumatobacter sp.]